MKTRRQTQVWKREKAPLQETNELEQFPPEQLWCTGIWISFDYLNGMYFSLPLLVSYQHLTWPQQYPNNPRTCSANGRCSAMSHSWKAHFSMEFSVIKRPRCSRMILLVLKRYQVLAKNCQEDGYLTVDFLETNSEMDICSWEDYIRESSWEVHL